MTTPHSKSRRAGLLAVAALLLAALAAWFFWPDANRTAPGDATAAAPAGAAAAAGKDGPQLFHKPLWNDLSTTQQLALAPLKDEWDVMEGTRKRKWLEMSRRFASMSPQEKDRVHDRMRQWVRLTPEQRKLARENYTRTRKLAPGEKAATWESYKQLTPDQKERLARKSQAAPGLPSSPMIVAPTSCPPGTTRRGASCMALQPPPSIPGTPAITQPAPAPAPPAGPGATAAPAAGAAAPSAIQPTAAPTASNANG